MEHQSSSDATVFGLASAAILSNIPDAWISYGDKLITGAILALVTGFAYKAGSWFLERLVKEKKRNEDDE